MAKNLFLFGLKWKSKIESSTSNFKCFDGFSFCSVCVEREAIEERVFRYEFYCGCGWQKLHEQVFSVFWCFTIFISEWTASSMLVSIFTEIDCCWWRLPLSMSGLRHDGRHSAKNYVRCGAHETIIKQTCFYFDFSISFYVSILIVFVGSSNWTL